MEYPKTSRRMTLAALTCIVLGLAACRDASAVNGPNADSAPLCATVDCDSFRALTHESMRVLLSASATTAVNLSDRGRGRAIEQRLAEVERAFVDGHIGAARLNLLGALKLIDVGLDSSSQQSDWPDLATIRINLEPIIIKLGLH